MRSKLLLPRYPNSNDADEEDSNKNDAENDDNNDQCCLRRRVGVRNKKFERRRRNFRKWSLCRRTAAHNLNKFLSRNLADLREQILKQMREIYCKLERKYERKCSN